MYISVFKDEELFDAYLNIAELSLGGDFLPWFRDDLLKSFNYTKELPDDFTLPRFPWVLYALYEDDGTLVGACALKEDHHAFDAAHIDFVGIRWDKQGQGYGKFLIHAMLDEIKKHSNLRSLILSTSPDQGFYEHIGMKKIGEMDASGHKRIFYALAVSDIPL